MLAYGKTGTMKKSKSIISKKTVKPKQQSKSTSTNGSQEKNKAVLQSTKSIGMVKTDAHCKTGMKKSIPKKTVKQQSKSTSTNGSQEIINKAGLQSTKSIGIIKTDATSDKKIRKRKSKSRMKKSLHKKAMKQQHSAINGSQEKSQSNAEFQSAAESEIKTDEMKNVAISNRKRRGAMKTISGSSNWDLLCSELKTDPLVRKTHPVKRPGEEDEIEEPAPKVAKPEVWFDVDEELLDSSDGQKGSRTPEASKSLVKEQSFTGQTKCIGMDCEMVGAGKDGEESILARVSLVNIYGNCLYDKFVLPREKVTDYRTAVSGVTKEILDQKGEPFMKVQKEVSDIIQGRILVGHALQNDLKVLFLSHPHKNIRDTSMYKPFRELFKGQKPSLKKLTEKVLGVKVQEAAHSSVEDSQAAMRLYTLHRKKWEKELKNFSRMKDKKKAKQKKKESKE